MAAETTYVIVGASLAGAKAAEILRDERFGGGPACPIDSARLADPDVPLDALARA
jgi:hypothetical protein